MADSQGDLLHHGLLEFARGSWAKHAYRFNEWFRAQDGRPKGQDWQAWAASMYLYAAECVTLGTTPFFDVVRDT